MPEGPFGFKRLTDIGPFVEITPDDWIVSENLYEDIRFELINSADLQQVSSENYADPYADHPAADSRKFQITITGEDEPSSDEDVGTSSGNPVLGTTLLVSCEQDEGEWPSCFHRLIMVDVKGLREKAMSLENETEESFVRFGTPMFDTRTDMVAAHWTIPEVRSHDEIFRSVHKMVELFNRSVEY